MCLPQYFSKTEQAFKTKKQVVNAGIKKNPRKTLAKSHIMLKKINIDNDTTIPIMKILGLTGRLMPSNASKLRICSYGIDVYSIPKNKSINGISITKDAI